jgi:hypothetical protein
MYPRWRRDHSGMTIDARTGERSRMRGPLNPAEPRAVIRSCRPGIAARVLARCLGEPRGAIFVKRLIPAAWMAAGMLVPVPASADVGVSITVGQPGFYGRIDIGNVPRPAVIYPQPVIIHQPPARVVQQPIYLRVPPGHAQNWHKHCAKYNACGQPVFFVQERWYQDTYGPRHRDHPGQGNGKGKGKGKDWRD